MKTWELLVYWFKGLFTCRVYVACKMTHRKRREMIRRAKHICRVFRKAGIDPISPVIEERMQARKGKLENTSKLRLHKKWQDDKDIICWTSHAVVMDGADSKSFGMEREHGLNRYLWWKPTLLLMPDQGLTVAVFEDDLITGDEEAVADYLMEKHGNLYKRWKWRFHILNKSFLKFLVGQVWQWIH